MFRLNAQVSNFGLATLAVLPVFIFAGYLQPALRAVGI